MKHLTDATFVIDVLHGRPAALALQPRLLQEGLALSIITYMELWEGVETNRDPRQAALVLRQFLQPVTVLPFSRTVARQTARLRAEMRRQRRPLEQRALDILIAGTALSYNLVMVTSDKDFADIPGLTLLNPRAAT